MKAAKGKKEEARKTMLLVLDGIMLVLLALLIFAFGLGPLAMIGVAAVLVLLSYEHSLVSKDDLSRLNAAFFTMNGVIAVVFFIFLALDLMLHHSSTI